MKSWWRFRKADAHIPVVEVTDEVVEEQLTMTPRQSRIHYATRVLMGLHEDERTEVIAHFFGKCDATLMAYARYVAAIEQKLSRRRADGVSGCEV